MKTFMLFDNFCFLIMRVFSSSIIIDLCQIDGIIDSVPFLQCILSHELEEIVELTTNCWNEASATEIESFDEDI